MQTLTQFLLIEVGSPWGTTVPFNQIFPDITFYKTGVLWRFMSWITNVLFCTCVSIKCEKSYTRVYVIQPYSAALISYLKTIWGVALYAGFCNEGTFSFLCSSCERLLLMRPRMRVQSRLWALLGITRQKKSVSLSGFFFERLVLMCLYATAPHTSVFFWKLIAT